MINWEFTKSLTNCTWFFQRLSKEGWFTNKTTIEPNTTTDRNWPITTQVESYSRNHHSETDQWVNTNWTYSPLLTISPHSTLMMTSAEVVETPITAIFQEYYHPEHQTTLSITYRPGLVTIIFQQCNSRKINFFSLKPWYYLPRIINKGEKMRKTFRISLWVLCKFSGENLTFIGIPLPSLNFFSREGKFSITETRSSMVVGSLSGRSVA